MTEDTQAAVVEWGSASAERVRWRASFGGPVGKWSAWASAGLGALALFGSLTTEWQIATVGELPPREYELGLGVVMTWGTGWLVGAVLLAACVGLALGGRSGVADSARVLGFSVAAALTVVLAAASVRLPQEALLAYGDPEVELSLGRGVYLAYLAVLLLAGALWLARLHAAARSDEVAGDGPTGRVPRPRAHGDRAAPPEVEPGVRDLTVTAADPLPDPADRDAWG